MAKRYISNLERKVAQLMLQNEQLDALLKVLGERAKLLLTFVQNMASEFPEMGVPPEHVLRAQKLLTELNQKGLVNGA